MLILVICTLENLLDRPVDVDTSPKWKQNGGDFCNTWRNFEWHPEFHLHFEKFLTDYKQLTVEGETNQGTLLTSEKAAMLNDAKIGDSTNKTKTTTTNMAKETKSDLNVRKRWRSSVGEVSTVWAMENIGRQMSLRNFRATFSIVEESNRPLSLNQVHYCPSSDVLFTTGVSSASTTATGERLHQVKAVKSKKDRVQRELLVLMKMKRRSSGLQTNLVITRSPYLYSVA